MEIKVESNKWWGRPNQWIDQIENDMKIAGMNEQEVEDRYLPNLIYRWQMSKMTNFI